MDICDVVPRQYGRYSQLDFGGLCQWSFNIWNASGLQRVNRAFQQLCIEGKSDLLNLATLLITEQFAGTTDFKVVGGERNRGWRA